MNTKPHNKLRLSFMSLALPFALVTAAPSVKADEIPYKHYSQEDMMRFKEHNAQPGRYPSSLPIRPRPDTNGYDQAWHNFPKPERGDTHFSFKIKGYVLGIKMISGHYEGVIGSENATGKTKYAVRTKIRSSGLGAMLKKLNIWSITKGHFTKDKFTPDTHVQQNLERRARRVEMSYDNLAETIDVGITPPVSTQGVELPSMAERYNGTDAVTTFLNMMVRSPSELTDPTKRRFNEHLCEGDINVFDSKQHYALRMNRNGTKRSRFLGKRVEAIRCMVHYVPINGFRAKDLPSDEEKSTPVKVYLSYVPELDLYVPFRFSYKISSIRAIVRVSDIWVNGQKIER